MDHHCRNIVYQCCGELLDCRIDCVQTVWYIYIYCVHLKFSKMLWLPVTTEINDKPYDGLIQDDVLN